MTVMKSNFDALKEALVSEIPSFERCMTADGKPIVDSSWGNFDGSRRRRDILVKIVAVLDELQSTVYQTSSLALKRSARTNALVRSLRSLGLRKSALQFCIKAQEVIEDFSDDDRELNRYLAESLMNEAACHIDMGNLFDARLSSIGAASIYSYWPVVLPSGRSVHEETRDLIDIFRGLAKDEPEVHNSHLALVLTLHSNVLGEEKGDEDEALAAIEEVVGIERTLASQNPELFELDLAHSLRYLSLRLSGVGIKDEALAAIQEAEGLYRRLSEHFPDAFHEVLADTLEILVQACLAESAKKAEDIDKNEGPNIVRSNRRSFQGAKSAKKAEGPKIVRINRRL